MVGHHHRLASVCALHCQCKVCNNSPRQALLEVVMVKFSRRFLTTGESLLQQSNGHLSLPEW